MCDCACDKKQEPAPVTAPIPSASRGARGRFLPGNKVGAGTVVRPGNALAALHGLCAAKLPPELAHLEAEAERFLAGSLVDDGDPRDVPTRRRSQHEYRARLHRRILQIDSALDALGIFDKRGKLRVAWLGKLEGLIGMALRLDASLGLARRARPVPNIGDYLAAKRDAASTGASAPSSAPGVSQAADDDERPGSGIVAFEPPISSPHTDERETDKEDTP